MPLDSFAVGSPYIPRNMTANIHEGEMIIDRQSSNILRQYGIPTSGSADNKEVVVELKAANRRLEQMEKRLANIETKARLVANS
jgi:hypothetical protein